MKRTTVERDGNGIVFRLSQAAVQCDLIHQSSVNIDTILYVLGIGCTGIKFCVTFRVLRRLQLNIQQPCDLSIYTK